MKVNEFMGELIEAQMYHDVELEVDGQPVVYFHIERNELLESVKIVADAEDLMLVDRQKFEEMEDQLGDMELEVEELKERLAELETE